MALTNAPLIYTDSMFISMLYVPALPFTPSSLHVIQGQDPYGIEDDLHACIQRKVTTWQHTIF